MNQEPYDIILYIQNRYNVLTGSQRQLADFILSNASSVINMTSHELSENANVSEASVVRFCQALGFKGYKDLKIKLAKDLGSSRNSPVPNCIDKSDDSWNVITKLMQLEYEDIKFCLEMLDSTVVLEALYLISNAKRVAFFGVGSSAIVAATAKEHFLHYGKCAQAEIEGYSQIVLANTLTEGDVCFSISISGQSRIPIQAAEIARKNGAKTICLCQNPHSALVKLCDCSIIGLRKSKEPDDLGTSTRIVQTSVIDALAVAYAARHWETTASLVEENRSAFKFQQIT